MKVTATIRAGIPGRGGDICFGEDSVRATVFDVPLTRINARTDKVSRQWIGRGALRYVSGTVLSGLRTTIVGCSGEFHLNNC